MKKFLFIWIFIATSLHAQVTEEWVNRYNGTGNYIDIPHSLAIDASGNILITGESVGSNINEHPDYLTIKYSNSGEQLWVARYDGIGNSIDKAYSIKVDGSENVVVSGVSIGNGGLFDCVTIKYNSVGTQQWLARYSSTTQYPPSIVCDGSGNVYLVLTANPNRIVTIKYDADGIEKWRNTYTAGSARAKAIGTDLFNNIYVTGEYLSDYLTIKYDSAGSQLWAVTRGGGVDNVDDPKALFVDNSGNVFVTGNSNNTSLNNTDYFTIKYNTAGVFQWAKKYNGSGNQQDYVTSITVNSLDYVCVTGWSYGGSLSGYNYATVIYNSMGQQIAEYIYNGSGNAHDVANDIVIDEKDNLYVTGSTETGVYSEYTTIKYNQFGGVVWIKNYNGLSGNTYNSSSKLALDKFGNVYVTGKSGAGNGNNQDYDYATIRYSQSVGIQQITSLIPSEFKLSQNYPNPFNPTTNIEFSLPEKSFVKLKVFDVSGKQITELVNENLTVGTYKVDFDGSLNSSGVYFYTLETEKFTETKRMVLIK